MKQRIYKCEKCGKVLELTGAEELKQCYDCSSDLTLVCDNVIDCIIHDDVIVALVEENGARVVKNFANENAIYVNHNLVWGNVPIDYGFIPFEIRAEVLQWKPAYIERKKDQTSCMVYIKGREVLMRFPKKKDEPISMVFDFCLIDELQQEQEPFDDMSQELKFKNWGFKEETLTGMANSFNFTIYFSHRAGKHSKDCYYNLECKPKDFNAHAIEYIISQFHELDKEINH